MQFKKMMSIHSPGGSTLQMGSGYGLLCVAALVQFNEPYLLRVSGKCLNI